MRGGCGETLSVCMRCRCCRVVGFAGLQVLCVSRLLGVVGLGDVWRCSTCCRFPGLVGMWVLQSM